MFLASSPQLEPIKTAPLSHRQGSERRRRTRGRRRLHNRTTNIAFPSSCGENPTEGVPYGRLREGRAGPAPAHVRRQARDRARAEQGRPHRLDRADDRADPAHGGGGGEAQLDRRPARPPDHPEQEHLRQARDLRDQGALQDDVHGALQEMPRLALQFALPGLRTHAVPQKKGRPVGASCEVRVVAKTSWPRSRGCGRRRRWACGPAPR